MSSSSSLILGAKAAVFYGPGKIAIEHKSHSRAIGGRTLDSIDNNNDNNKGDVRDALLKIRSCCVCGYDARVFRNGHRKVTPPVILGHEICAETTRDIDSLLKAGTRVAVYPVAPCLSCIHCQNRMYNLCRNIREIGSTLDGGFSDYILVPKEVVKVGGLVPIPDTLTDEEASLIEPLACCVNNISKISETTRSNDRRIESLAVVGDGPMGMLHVQLAKRLLEVKTNVVVGRISRRIEFGKSFGATSAFSTLDDQLLDMLEPTGGNGYDVVVIAASDPSALALGTKLAARGGCISIFAGINGNGSASIDPNIVHYNELSVLGSFSSTPKHFKNAVDLASNKIVDLSKLVTHTFSLDSIHEAISVTETYQGMKVAVKPNI